MPENECCGYLDEFIEDKLASSCLRVISSLDNKSRTDILALFDDFEDFENLEDLSQLFQNNWNGGTIFSNWGKIYYQETQSISQFPIYLYDGAYEARDSKVVTHEVIQYLRSLI